MQVGAVNVQLPLWETVPLIPAVPVTATLEPEEAVTVEVVVEVVSPPE
jgi:hypothetical protein